tara:strand:+ start:2187 stop:2303 length:117 start_codon:yes stop_codon:yes gene_type:complete
VDVLLFGNKLKKIVEQLNASNITSSSPFQEAVKETQTS